MVEMLVVMAILVLLATVSIPWFNKIRRRAQIRSAAMEISTTLTAARMKAVKRNANVTVVITPASGATGYNTIATIEPTPAVAPTPGANISSLNIAGRTLRFVEKPAGGITFDGGGRRIAPPSPIPGTIVIEGPVGGGLANPITIETNSAGRVRIITPVAWQ